VAGGGSPIKLQQPLALLPTRLSQNSPTRGAELPAGGSLVGARPALLPPATVLTSRMKQHPDQSLHHSEGGFNVHRINVNSFYFVYFQQRNPLFG